MRRAGSPPRDERARRARPVLALFVASVALGLVLLFAFDSKVQTVDAAELVARKDDARAFLVGDYLFVPVYAVLSPVAIWRFRAVGGGVLSAGAALVLVAAGVIDAAENSLLLSATDSVSEDTVDAAHALAIPKTTLFVAGAVLALAVNVRAVQALRRGRS